MKRILFFLLAAPLLLTTWGGCSDDDDMPRLPGTAWIYEETGENFYAKSVLTFTSEDTLNGIWVENDESGTLEGTYSYDPPRVEFLIDGVITTGTIQGSKLTMDEDENSDGYIFFRQK